MLRGGRRSAIGRDVQPGPKGPFRALYTPSAAAVVGGWCVYCRRRTGFASSPNTRTVEPPPTARAQRAGLTGVLLNALCRADVCYQDLPDGCVVVIAQDHLCGFFSDLCAGDTHGNPDVCRFDGGDVVDTVACHWDDLAVSLEGVGDLEFVLWRDARKRVRSSRLPRAARESSGAVGLQSEPARLGTGTLRSQEIPSGESRYISRTNRVCPTLTCAGLYEVDGDFFESTLP